MGTVGILSVGAGDTKLTFDPSNPAETIRAARVVKDMIRRGYALLIEVPGADGKKSYQRATDFDEKTCEYIIADLDPLVAEKADREGLDDGPEIASPEATPAPPEPRRGPGRPKGRRIAASKTGAVAVARTAGG